MGDKKSIIEELEKYQICSYDFWKNEVHYEGKSNITEREYKSVIKKLREKAVSTFKIESNYGK